MTPAPSSRPPLAVAWTLCLLAAPVAAQGVTRLLSAWTGESHVAPAVTFVALVPVLLAGIVALLTAVARPVVGGSLAALTFAASLLWIGPVAAITTTLIAGWLAAVGLPRLATVVPVPRGRVAGAFWALLAVLAVVQNARMSVFMADPTQRWGALLPSVEFATKHSCLTSYVHGAALVEHDVNIYDDRYSFESEPQLPAVIDIGPLTMDSYEYPPQFLPLPALFRALTGDFMAIRALWFLLTAAVFAGVSVVIARWLGGEAGRRALLLAPAVWLSPPLLITAYFGNFQSIAMALSALAMLAIFRGHTRSGAALLAFLIGAKIFPGILGVYLLAARRFAAAAWTAAFSALFAALALLVVGTLPFVDFIKFHLPRLASGETFSFLSEPGATMTNFGAFGIPFKLRLIGWAGSEADAWALARPVAWTYTLIVVAVAVAAGWRRQPATSTQQQVALLGGWFGLLALGAMRSPFAPPEALIPILWALSLRAAAASRPRDASIAAALWIVMMIVIPTPAPA
ncbi:MAG TPA: glycosyltransferase family 87 protein, partial [Nannocystis sp.]